MSIKYNKLIRDNIPEIIDATGKSSVVKAVDDVTYKELLKKKLVEEVEEYIESEEVEELADILEVLLAITKTHQLEWKSVEEIANRKREERGGFEKKLLLVEVKENLNEI